MCVVVCVLEALRTSIAITLVFLLTCVLEPWNSQLVEQYQKYLWDRFQNLFSVRLISVPSCKKFKKWSVLPIANLVVVVVFVSLGQLHVDCDTSFGWQYGYVSFGKLFSTSVPRTTFSQNRCQHQPSPIAHRPSPITHHPSPITHRPLLQVQVRGGTVRLRIGRDKNTTRKFWSDRMNRPTRKKYLCFKCKISFFTPRLALRLDVVNMPFRVLPGGVILTVSLIDSSLKFDWYNSQFTTEFDP